MMTLLGLLVFIAAFGTASAVLAATIAPQWQRILNVAMGADATFQPLRQLAYAERRIAVRRWSAVSSWTAVQRRREVA